MNRRLFAATAAALLLAASVWSAPARADLLDWTYSSNSSTVTATTGTGAVNVTGVTGGGNNYSDVVLANLKTTATDASTFVNSPYSVDFTLTDTTSGQSHVFTFTGEFSGALSPTSAQVTNAFTGLQTQTFTLGANDYTVTLSAYAAPGNPLSTGFGTINGNVSVKPSDSTGVPNGVPEPSALLLAGLGCSSLLAMRFRRRKAAQPA